MISKAKTINDYLKEVPEKRKEALMKIRELCKEILVGYKENMEYGGPTYKKDKGIEIGFGSQKNYIGFYCLVHQVMIDNKELLKDFDHGKGVIRFHPDKVDFDLIRKILIDTINSDEKPC